MADGSNGNGWSVARSADTYQVRGWGDPYFQINERGGVAFKGVIDWWEDGGAGNDLIVASGNVDRIIGGSGRDSVFGGGGADYLTINANDDVAGEVYDGGSGDFDWLIHDGQQYGKDLSYAPLPDAVVKKAEAKLRTITSGGQPLLTASPAA